LKRAGLVRGVPCYRPAAADGGVTGRPCCPGGGPPAGGRLSHRHQPDQLSPERPYL